MNLSPIVLNTNAVSDLKELIALISDPKKAKAVLDQIDAGRQELIVKERELAGREQKLDADRALLEDAKRVVKDREDAVTGREAAHLDANAALQERLARIRKLQDELSA